MKKIIFTLLALFPTMTYAQDKNDCVDAVTAHKGMAEQYGEKPFVDLNEKGVRQLIISCVPSLQEKILNPQRAGLIRNCDI